jgi:type 1 glutamine amidotransferase
MPENYGQALTPEQQEDLLTFLLTNPLEPAHISRFEPAAPPPRTHKEIVPFLSVSNAPPETLSELRVLLVADEKDHGVDEHNYPLWMERWSKLLALAHKVTVTTNTGFPSRNQLAGADVTVFCSRNTGWDVNAASLLDEYLARGGGLVYLHWAIEGGKDTAALAERIGLAFSMSKFRHGPMRLAFNKVEHPITRGFTDLNFVDETYWALHGDVLHVRTLAEAVEENSPRPQLWTTQRGKGRVFVCIPGHYTWTFDDPLYRILVLRGIAWVAGEKDVNRLTELAVVGARISP